MAILVDGTVPTSVSNPLIRTDADDFKTDVLNFTEVKVDRITFFNKVLTMQTIILSVKRKFGEARKLRRYVLKQNESAEYLNSGEFLPLRAGDVIEAVTTTADAVDFVIHGTLS